MHGWTEMQRLDEEEEVWSRCGFVEGGEVEVEVCCGAFEGVGDGSGGRRGRSESRRRARVGRGGGAGCRSAPRGVGVAVGEVEEDKSGLPLTRD